MTTQNSTAKTSGDRIAGKNRKLFGGAALVLFVTAIFLTTAFYRQSAGGTAPGGETDAAKSLDRSDDVSPTALPVSTAVTTVPGAYSENCAKCHGDLGEGTKKGPELLDVTSREEDPLSDEKLIEIIDDAKSLGLSAKMPSFRDDLSGSQKAEIANWIRSIDAGATPESQPRTQTAQAERPRKNKE